MAYPKKHYLWPQSLYITQNSLRLNVLVVVLFNYFSFRGILLLLHILMSFEYGSLHTSFGCSKWMSPLILMTY